MLYHNSLIESVRKERLLFRTVFINAFDILQIPACGPSSARGTSLPLNQSVWHHEGASHAIPVTRGDQYECDATTSQWSTHR